MTMKILTNLRLMGFRARREEFYDELAQSYDNRESLRTFLEEELKIAVAKATRNTSRAYALRIMSALLASGDSHKYSQIVGPVMPAADAMMLTALDDAPDKAALMRAIARSVREQKEMVAMAKRKLLPPLLILPGAFVFSLVMAHKSLPIVTKVAPPEVWTFFNMAVRLYSEFIASYGVTAVVVAALAFACFVHQLPRWKGAWRGRLESIKPATATLLFPICPFLLPLSIYRDVQAGLLFSALSVMLQAGRTLNDALATIQRSSMPWMRWHVARILGHLEVNPTEYQRAFAKGFVSPQLLARLSSQIRTNPRFDQVLITLGAEGSKEVRQEVDKRTSVVNYMLLGLGGGLIAFMMAGQISIGQKLREEMSPAKQMARRHKMADEARRQQALPAQPRAPAATGQ